MAQMCAEIRLEALHIARQMVKDCIVANGCKVHHFKSDEITRAAHEIIHHLPERQAIIQQAWDICKMRYEVKRMQANAQLPR